MYLGIFSINDTVYFRVNTVNQQGSAVDATSGPTFAVYSEDESTEIDTGTMTKVGTKTGFYEASFTCDSASYSVGQYFILIEATVAGQTPSASVSFQLLSDELSLEETFQEIQLIGDSMLVVGQGSVSINHDYESTDNYRVTANGTPLADVDIRAFVKTDYDLGRKANRYIVGQTVTGTDGRWRSVIRLNPGEYTLEFSKKGAYRTLAIDITVASVGSMAIESFSTFESPDITVDQQIELMSDYVLVDQDFKGTNSLRVVSDGKPIKGVQVKAFRKKDYNEGKRDENYVIQRTVTDKKGNWQCPLRLIREGVYVIEFSKKGVFEPNTITIKT